MEKEIKNKHGGGRKRELPRDFLRMDWDPLPGQDNITRIQRLMITTDNKQEKELKNMTTPINTDLEPNMSKVLVWNNNKWEVTGQRCLDCGKVMSKQTLIDKHPSICDKGLLINKQEEQELLQLVRRKQNASTESSSER